jgi:hypothetical protein
MHRAVALKAQPLRASERVDLVFSIRESGQKKKPVIAWETTTGLRGGEGRNYINP